MEKSYFAILFFIRRAKPLRNGEVPICLRITVNSQRAEVQIKRSIHPDKWNSQKGCAIGKEVACRELNLYLDAIRSKILTIHREFEQDNEPFNSQILLNKYLGVGENQKMLLVHFEIHNKRCRELLDIDYVLGTVLRYERTVIYLSEYMKKTYKINDIPFKKIDYDFIKGFEHFIKTKKKCAHNATTKYLCNLKKIVKIALNNGWITCDPFVEIHLHQTPSNRDFLLESELMKIYNKQFEIERLETVRDIFIFCCFTGLAFADIKELKVHHIICDEKGESWIYKPRHKTDVLSRIPLLKIPLDIITKYKDHPECSRNHLILPVPSNQRMNSYLKEIADVCGIKKNLSTHIARHTFACTAIANGISMDVIAKILGHTSIRTTRIYAKLLDSTISDGMQLMRNKYDLMDS